MTVDALLSRLEGVRKTGAGRWIARCPTRRDRRPSLSIRELPDGRVLVHDFAGDAVEDILAAAGLDISALFPDKPLGHRVARERRPFFASDALLCLAFEAMFLGICANDLAAGKPLEESDRARLWTSVQRIGAAQELCNG